MGCKKKCAIDSLPIDVLMKILLLLSVDELTRLKGVCKLWFKLITSRHFSRSHCSPQRNQSVFEFVSVAGGLLVHHGERLLSLSLSFSCKETMRASVNYSHLEDCLDDTIKGYLNPNQKTQFNVLDSCNGLVLIEVDENSFIDGKPRLLVCNPFTKSCTLITGEVPGIGRYDWIIAYDSSAGRYKVLGMQKLTDPYHTCVIFDPEYEFGLIRTHSMKELSIALPRGYWIASLSASTNGKDKVCFLAKETELLPALKGFLVSIDVSKEDWKVSPVFALPRGTITRAKGAFHHTKCSNTREFEHWVLQVDFDSPRWVVHLRVSVNECPWFVNGRPQHLSCPMHRDRTGSYEVVYAVPVGE